jgi:CheY-like chemotaxis protein
MISILIVEDENEKYDLVERKVLETGISKSFISRTKNVQDTLGALENSQFDILILDLQLPKRDGEEKDDTAGLDILKTIKHEIKRKRDTYRTPHLIIGLTQHTGLFDEQAKLFTEQRVFSYFFDGNDDKWVNDIQGTITDYAHTKQFSVEPKRVKKVIYSVHGIMSYGGWQNRLDEYLSNQSEEYEHIQYQYNFLPVISFLIPPLRDIEVKSFVKELQDLANQNRDVEVNIIAHSFGTYVVAKALSKISLISSPKINRVVLCGSVLKAKYQFQPVINKFNISGILNDCAVSDKALVMSQVIALRLGMGGRVGFKNTYSGLVKNRYLSGGHGTFFNTGVFKDWVNYISMNEINIINVRTEPSIIEGIKATVLAYSPYILLSLIGYAFIF